MSPRTSQAAKTEGGRTAHRDHDRTVISQDFPYSGTVALCLVLVFAGLSKATAYKWGLVPEYDDSGRLVETGKVPPFPWMRMPHSLIRNRRGKKLFLADEIRTWLKAVRDRSRQIDAIAINNPNALVEREDN